MAPRVLKIKKSTLVKPLIFLGVLFLLFSPMFSEVVVGVLTIPSTPGTKIAAEPVTGTLTFLGSTFMEFALGMLWYVLYFLNYLVSNLIGYFGSLLNVAIDIAMAPLQGLAFLNTGWGIVRDVANIFFIFILLVIAIATILRIETYGAKALLAKLIIVALLINFSLVIGAFVIDISNVLAITFVQQIYPVSDKIAAAIHLEDVWKVPAPTNVPAPAVSTFAVPANFIAALEKYKDVQPGSGATIGVTTTSDVEAALIQTFLLAAMLLLQIITMFVLLSVSGLLIIRTVALMILLIMAPAGFLMLILPTTRSWGMQWWQKLFSWSFFFPASMFLIYLAILYGVEIGQAIPLLAAGSPSFDIALLFNYLVITALMFGSLIVARQLGIIGAAAMIGVGMAAARRARGYAGRGVKYAGGVAAMPITKPARAVGRYAGDVAGQALGSDFARRLGQVPVIRGVLKPLEAVTKKREELAAKEAQGISKLSPAQQATRIGVLSARAQAKLIGGMNERQLQDFVQALPDDVARTNQLARVRQFVTSRDINNFAAATGDLHQAMQMTQPQFSGMPNPPAAGSPQAQEYQQRVNDFLGGLSDQQMRNLNAQSIQTGYFQNYFLNNARNFNDIINNRAQIEAASRMMEAIRRREGAPTSDRLAAVIRTKYHNEALARQVESNIGINIMFHPEDVAVRSRRGQPIVSVQQQQQQTP